MAILSPTALEKWKKKRRNTTIIFTIQTLFLGFEYSVTFLTLWLYIKNLVKPETPKLYYGFISVAYLLGILVSSLITGKVVDKFRCIRLSFFICNMLVIIGNIIYALPFSPWLLLIGRFIAGSGGALRPIISGEIARCYPTKEISSKLSLMGMAFSFGFIIGPAINIAFEKFDIWIGDWHIIYENIPGLYMAMFFIIVQVLSVFCVHDVSKEYDFKAENVEFTNVDHTKDEKPFDSGDHIDDTCNEEDLSVKICSKSRSDSKDESYNMSTEKLPLLGINSSKGVFYVLKKLFGNIDVTLIMFISLYSRYLILTLDLWLPFLVIDIMHWSITSMNVIIFGAAVTCIVAMLLFQWKSPSDKNLFVIAVISNSFFILVLLVFMILPYWHDLLGFDIFMWVIMAVGWSLVIVNEEIFLIGCLAKLVSSEIQTFSESIRISMCNIGALLALSTSALIYDWVLYIGIGYFLVIFIASGMMIWRRRILQNPEVMIF